ncbi:MULTISPECIES: Hcp family type VI secretion system effector [Dickeya]|uniref:Type VI secretion system tube protein Hcp n=1 Tax=Dickeya fangzhongdai TaxID=1778540 RepID=A0A2K8QSY2_9GAMM|nr:MULTISPECIES: Hcp family type VI secretion system effector [Dickeya]ATZ95880.1 type VI secretion system tube protein Hcp [Dickeya fangzhongdai]QOH49323.1 Hcp family type VI secretion system effector [Dickeya fangzhongdai]QOH53627.1 Hcp family type VI secretion system effector [Dickeya fangzhongdai]WOX99169.1 Hcp family type VI secretion system effector [Dickeya fangzhongdai]WOY05679.1 Hcp family type VI secretion system effector [Dickeya fangzhongdai]
MANIIYLSLHGEKQGLISAGCSTVPSIGNLYQAGHEDEIFIYELNTNIMREENISFQPVQVRKPIDKATPLISQALNENETLTCNFSIFRTSISGGVELYFKINLLGAIISNISSFYPNSLTHNDIQPCENISIKFNTIEWENVAARTNSYMFWRDSTM